MEKQLDLLKAQAPPGGAGGSAGTSAERVAALQKKAALLANTTGSMLKTLEGTSRSHSYRTEAQKGLLVSKQI